MNDNFKVYPEYADTVNIHYDSIIDSFNSSSSDKINKWANDSTRGKIPEIVNDLILSDPSLAVIITNAVYFNASWVHKFPEYNTVKSDFWIDTKKSVDVDMMEQAIGQLHYAEIDGVQILKIPYKSDSNRLSMIIALPKDIDGIKDLENNLTYDMFIAWTRDTEPRNVQMHIPKFKITAKYGSDATIPAFQNLGIYDLFNPARANLSGMSNDHLYVSDIFHDVFVNVDEIGIKAAAVTSIMNYKLDDHVIVYLDPVTFRADHPFIFTIWDDETNVILFMGKMSDPTKYFKNPTKNYDDIWPIYLVQKILFHLTDILPIKSITLVSSSQIVQCYWIKIYNNAQVYNSLLRYSCSFDSYFIYIHKYIMKNVTNIQMII